MKLGCVPTLCLLVVGAVLGFYFEKTIIYFEDQRANQKRIESDRKFGRHRPTIEMRGLAATDSVPILAASDSQALARIWEATGTGFRGQAARQIALAHWVIVDPRGGCDFFQGDDIGLRRLLEQWALVDHPATVDHMVELGAEKADLRLVADSIEVRSPSKAKAFFDYWLLNHSAYGRERRRP